MKFFFNQPFSKGEIGIYVLFLSICAGFAWASAQSQSPLPVSPAPKTSSPHSPEIVFPEISPAFSSQKFIGQVRSNSQAMVHSRREGLIKDVAVDVGDSIAQGQVLAYFFPPGVEGQSTARIQKALAELSSAKEELQKAKLVSQESQNLSQTHLEQTQVKLSHFVDAGPIRSKIKQQQDQMITQIYQIAQNVGWILFGDNKSSLSRNSIIGSFNDALQENKVFNAWQDFEKKKAIASNISGEKNPAVFFEVLEALEVLLNETEELYQNAKGSPLHPKTTIEKHQNQIYQYQNTLLGLKNTWDSLILSIRETEEEVRQKQSTLSLTKSQNDRAINLAQKKVDIAQAAYESELATSGHSTLRAPFSGIITEKWVEAGQAVSPSTPLFALENAPHGLSSRGTQVVFEVPLSSQKDVSLGEKVKISFPYSQKTSSALIEKKEEALDERTGTFSVFARLEEDQSFIPGERVFVHLEKTKEIVWRVPSVSLKRKGVQDFVWTKINDTLYHIPVTVLAQDGEKSDIRGPLSRDMEIVKTASASFWRDSQPFPNPSKK